MICKNVGEGEGGSGSGAGGSKRDSVGDTGIGIRSGIGPSPHAGVDRGRHQGGGVPGSQRLQWSRVEWGGGLKKWAEHKA